MAIGVYTPIQLPHPPIPLSTLLKVEEALRVAWDLLRNDPGFDLANADEDKITQQFRTTVCNRVLNEGVVPGFTRALFSVSREAKFGNYKGDEIDNMPDLVIEIRDERPKVSLPSDDGLFVECKPVDIAHPVGRDYCGAGLIRFVNGRYAWAMTEAMMIGYVRAGYTIQPKLEKALKDRAKMTVPDAKIVTLDYPAPCSQSVAETWCEIVHISRHERTFPYPQIGKPAPTITIRHLWLRRD
jgi:hypothetical protein